MVTKRLRKVIGYWTKASPNPVVLCILECYHAIPMPRGLCDESTKRYCKYCALLEREKTYEHQINSEA